MDFNLNKLQNGHFSGKILLKPDQALYNQILDVDLELDLILELNADTADEEITVALNFLLDNELFLGISLDGKETEVTEVKKPSAILDPMNEAQLTQWIESLNFDKLCSNLKKSEIPSDLVNALEEYFKMIGQNLD